MNEAEEILTWDYLVDKWGMSKTQAEYIWFKINKAIAARDKRIGELEETIHTHDLPHDAGTVAALYKEITALKAENERLKKAHQFCYMDKNKSDELRRLFDDKHELFYLIGKNKLDALQGALREAEGSIIKSLAWAGGEFPDCPPGPLPWEKESKRVLTTIKRLVGACDINKNH